MRRLDPRDRESILARIEQYAGDPTSPANQLTALSGSEYLRIRVGAYRVIFRLEGATPVIMAIRRVLHRREAYD